MSKLRAPDAIRDPILAQRRALSPAEVELKSQEMGKQLFSQIVPSIAHILSGDGPSRDIALYCSMQGEPQAETWQRPFEALGYRCVYPKWDHEMRFHPEPAHLALVIVPGLLFGLHGERMGRGKGHYDRFLAARRAPNQPPFLAVAVGYEFQVRESLLQHPWDQPMDALLTETQVRWFKSVLPGAKPEA